MSDVKDFERLRDFVAAAIVRVANGDNQLEVMDETMDEISENFVVVYYGPSPLEEKANEN